MSTTRHIIVCEGESERVYLQMLQAFLDRQAQLQGAFDTPLIFIVPSRVVARGGAYGRLQSHYKSTWKEHRKTSIKIWADFDLYHRNDFKCADHYKAKPAGIPDFLFSFHNFEDFYALHFDGQPLSDWLQFGGTAGRRHFTTPLHSEGYLPEIERIFPGYEKAGLPAGFVSWASLRNLKANLHHQPITSNPQNIQGLLSFATFLVGEIERVYPGSLDPVPAAPVTPPAP